MTDTYGGNLGAGSAGTPDYPATFRFDAPEKVANWRPVVNWLLAIPHFMILWALSQLSRMCGIISWVAILFTGRLPSGLADAQALYLRYSLRTWSFAGFLREEYPPFSFSPTPGDPGDDARALVAVEPDLGERNRLTAFFRIILAIPHLILVALLEVALLVVAVIGFFAVLFTGRWPVALRSFALGVARWWLRVQAYVLLLTDQYPPFAFDDLGGTAPQPVTAPPAPA
jgi:uncharacterized protein DUF4389